MDQRFYHGDILPQDIAHRIIAHFNRGNLQAQQIGNAEHIIVQITTNNIPISGGHTAISVNIQQVKDGVAISLGKQAWLGIAASLSKTALAALRNPFSLLGRIDDLAQDIESIQLSEDVWSLIEDTMSKMGAGFELSNRLRRIVCDYCSTGNLVGESRCIACGAPLGKQQPNTCSTCGYVITQFDRTCPNCGKLIY